MGRREDHHLSGIGGIGDYFLVPGHGCVEDDLTSDRSIDTDGSAFRSQYSDDPKSTIADSHPTTDRRGGTEELVFQLRPEDTYRRHASRIAFRQKAAAGYSQVAHLEKRGCTADDHHLSLALTIRHAG